MHRFYNPELNNQEIVIIKSDNDIYHQLTKVLRIKIWEEIIFFDWNNFFDYIYKIDSIENKNIVFKIINKIEKSSDNKIDLNLYQSLPNKQEKIEYIIQKWVEVWYNCFTFLKSERSQSMKISENKIDRFKKIIIEAVEQSWRNTIPEIYFLQKVDQKSLKWTNIYFHTSKDNSKQLKNLNFKQGKINVFIWPEWGFSDNEINDFYKTWFTKVNLWDNILRTETAWIVVWFFILQNL